MGSEWPAIVNAKRNDFNEIPNDLKDVYNYDGKELCMEYNGWMKEPDNKNKLHQDITGPQGDDARSNKKFCHINNDGSSYEVIICFPNDEGTEPYLVDDQINGGTYNYVHPEGAGYIGHFFADVLPYFVFDYPFEKSARIMYAITEEES